jgi:hypothetical protein
VFIAAPPDQWPWFPAQQGTVMKLGSDWDGPLRMVKKKGRIT